MAQYYITLKSELLHELFTKDSRDQASSKLLEEILNNEEIRSLDRVIRIYPNKASAIRLIGALLIEHDEKWSAGKKYFKMDDYYNFLNLDRVADNSSVA